MIRWDAFTLEAPECLALAQTAGARWAVDRSLVCQPMTTTGSVSRPMHSFTTCSVIANPFIPPFGFTITPAWSWGRSTGRLVSMSSMIRAWHSPQDAVFMLSAAQTVVWHGEERRGDGCLAPSRDRGVFMCGRPVRTRTRI